MTGKPKTVDAIRSKVKEGEVGLQGRGKRNFSLYH